MVGFLTRPAGCRHCISHSFITLGELFESISKIMLSNDNFVINYIIKYVALLHKDFQTNNVFNDQLRVSVVELRIALRSF